MKTASDVFGDVLIVLILLEEEIGGVGFSHAGRHEFLCDRLHVPFQLTQELRCLGAEANVDQRFQLSLDHLLNLPVEIAELTPTT